MFTFLLVVQAIIAALLVTVILMQRSEGGGLTSSGSPSGLMSARGAADFLTRSTAVLATIFVAMSIALAFIAANHKSTTIDTSLARSAPATRNQDAAGDASQDALKAAAAQAAATGNGAAATNQSGVPLQQ
ncbi:preprotein translocase subunit SecG [Sphingomonas donggukensis]|uniref:Protein-export membrane protein SecG n=1 Tax=Sphingomonas donggukensis TaxID=2949093 RepID=A0ABY4U0Y9_9SPHN|nr:preprotein translocase subunit SecG [Sphingomonas donggukensis]URW76446.1 preprotein translocase subunit SecG [Sphingomonas donggukensis]